MHHYKSYHTGTDKTLIKLHEQYQQVNKRFTGMKSEVPIIKNLEEKHVACYSSVGIYASDPKSFANTYDMLCVWAGSKGLITPATTFLSAYRNNPKHHAPEKIKLDACIEIPESAQVGGEFRKKVLPGGSYAIMRAELTCADEYLKAWKRVIEWAEDQRYVIDSTRPSYEIYLNQPGKHPNEYHLIECCVGVLN